MPKAICTQNFIYGATGETYERGVEYDVPAATLKANPDYFEKQAGTAENKMADTGEDKSEEETEEATEAAE